MFLPLKASQKIDVADIRKRVDFHYLFIGSIFMATAALWGLVVLYIFPRLSSLYESYEGEIPLFFPFTYVLAITFFFVFLFLGVFSLLRRRDYTNADSCIAENEKLVEASQIVAVEYEWQAIWISWAILLHSRFILGLK